MFFTGSLLITLSSAINSMVAHTLSIFFHTPLSLSQLERHMDYNSVMILLTKSSLKWSLRSLISRKAILLDYSGNALESFNMMVCCSLWAHPTARLVGNNFSFHLNLTSCSDVKDTTKYKKMRFSSWVFLGQYNKEKGTRDPFLLLFPHAIKALCIRHVWFG